MKTKTKNMLKKLVCVVLTTLLALSTFSMPFSYLVANAETTEQETFSWQKYTHYLTDQAYKGTNLNGQTTNDHIILNGNIITFYGYGKPQYIDYLFMQNDSSDKKTFTFKIDEAGINYHSMYGGGFLFNGKIENDMLTSYMLLYEQGGIGLYKVGPVNATNFNNGTQTWSKITTFVKTGSVHDIKIEVDSSILNMWDNGTQIVSNYKLSQVIGNGFGPIAVYKSHNCTILSYFTFSNLKMKIADKEIVIIPIPKFIDVDSSTPYQTDLSWSSVNQAIRYDLEIDGNIVDVGNTTSYSHLNLFSGTTHKYKVRAICPFGTGEWSDEVGTITLGEPNTWTKKASMLIPRTSAVTLNVNKKIYVLGGITTTGIATKSIEVYDPSNNSWTESSNMTKERSGMAGASIGDKIYIFGGKEASKAIATCEVFDTKKQTWSNLPDMPTPRFNTSAVSVGGKIYVIGGHNGNRFINVVEEYDPATNQWSSKQIMPTARSMSAITAINDIIYVIGGYNGDYLNVVEAYDTSKDIWEQKASMTTARRNLGVAAINDLVYAVGGNNTNGELTKLEMYNPALDTWTDKMDMPTPRSYCGFVSVYGAIFAIGGVLKGSPCDNVEMYNP